MIASGLPLVGRILVWAIVIGCTGTFIWRRIQGIPMRGKPRDKSDAAHPSTPPPGVAGVPSTTEAAPPSFGAPARLPADPAASPFPSAGLPAGSPDVAPPTTPPGPPAATAGDGRRGFFAPADDAPDASRDVDAPSPNSGRATVAEALRGIAMPCGLSPVVDGSSALPNPFRVSFLTNQATAAEVGRALADELQRLGFTLSTAAATELLGRRDRTELRVVLYPTASSARRGLEQLFPAAGPGAVGVELST